MQLSLAARTKLEIVELTFSQTLRGAISHTFSILLIALWYSHVAPLMQLLLWVATILIVTILRIVLYSAYKKHSSAQTANLWMHAWNVLFFFLGVFYVTGFIFFTPLDKPEYVVSFGLFVIALSAASMIGYTASFYATLSFFIPIVVPSVFFLFYINSPSGTVTAFTTLIFGSIGLALLKNSNRAYQKSIYLNFEHKQEIEKRKHIEKKLHDMSRSDSLTGLFNRRYFDEMLEIELGRAKRNKSPLCLIMFDIDCFKEYNDKYGHVSGDNCLREIAEIATSFVARNGDILARYGGEEFAVILPNIELDGAVIFAKKLQQGIQNKNILHDATNLSDLKCITISAGVTSLLKYQDVSATDLIENADAALYKAKDLGRNRVHTNSN